MKKIPLWLWIVGGVALFLYLFWANLLNVLLGRTWNYQTPPSNSPTIAIP